MSLKDGDTATWLALLKSFGSATIMAILKEIVEPTEKHTLIQKLANAVIVGALAVGFGILLLRFIEVSEIELLALSSCAAYLGKEQILIAAKFLLDRGLKRHDSK